MLTTIGPENACRTARTVGDVHRYVAAKLDMPNRYAMVKQILFEGEAAAKKEGHHVVSEVVANVIAFFDQFAMPENPVAWNVDPDISLRAGCRGGR